MASIALLKMGMTELIFVVLFWVQNGNCKKMARENFSIGAI